MIGVNWFLLAYSTALWAKRWSSIPFFQMIIGATLMVGLDLFIEPLSARLGFWAWENNNIPLENYIAWFMVSFLIHFIFVRLRITQDTPLARWYLPMIGLFFIMLNLFL